MTDEERDELRKLATDAKARAAAATDGPWWVREGDTPTVCSDIKEEPWYIAEFRAAAGYERPGERMNSQTDANAVFTAAAREDVPTLADAVLRLLADVDLLKAMLHDSQQESTVYQQGQIEGYGRGYAEGHRKGIRHGYTIAMREAGYSHELPEGFEP